MRRTTAALQTPGRSRKRRVFLPAMWGACGAVAALATATLAIWAIFFQPVPFGEAADRFPPVKMGVIDLGRAFNESHMKKEFQEELDSDFQAKKDHLTELDKEVQRLKGEMALVTSGSQEHRSLQTQILHKSADLKFEAEQAEKDFTEKRAGKFKVVLDLVYSKTKEYSKAHGLDVVLQQKLTLEENMPSWDSAFYFRPELDITDDVIRLINGS